jgi:polyisoprenyl-phosphate glycosyltransferase
MVTAELAALRGVGLFCCGRMTSPHTVDLLIPVFNEGASLHGFHSRLTNVVAGLPQAFRFLYINDGSTDDSAEVLSELVAADSRVYAIHLSRNFGHQAAISAGLDVCSADVVIMMDGDGEHPPTLIPEMLRLFESGYEIVHTQRLDRGRSGFFLKKITSKGFYWTINRLGETRIAEGSADFRLMSQDAVKALRQLPEYHRFYRGMVQWIGFRSVILPFVPEGRIAGKSKYSLKKMLRLAGDGMFSFSLAPLRLGLVIGAIFLLLTAAEIGYVLSFWIRSDTSSLVPGWSSLIVVITVSSAFSMLLIGILGIYVGMIFQEVKRRPVYLLKGHISGLEDAEHRNSPSVPQDLAATFSGTDVNGAIRTRHSDTALR